jgi:phosphoribosylformylglycinamidine synthase subunit PurSL
LAVHEIRVSNLENSEPEGNNLLSEAETSLGITGIDHIATAKVYRVEGVSDADAGRLARELFTDPVSNRYAVDEPIEWGTPHVVEKAYIPGAMNPEAEAIMKASRDLGIHPVAVDSSMEYAFFGSVEKEDVERIVGKLLVNKTIERVVTEKPDTLVFEGSVGPVNTVAIRRSTNKGLMELSNEKLFLNLDEMKVIRTYFKDLGRDPTDCELEIIAARWSEHCGHKTFNAKVIVDGVEKPPLFQRIRDKAREHFKGLVVSAFGDNSGVIQGYDGQALCAKVETHNKPSASEPYGGANTGVGGVLRDIMGTGQGAKNIVATDMFCFAPPSMKDNELPPGTLHPDYLQRRVIQGVRDYGNRMGIPTGNGSIHYHPDFRANPSVIVGAYGITPEERAQKGEPAVGDHVVIIGGRTGRDGIHGATFSSGQSTEQTSTIHSSAVQIGNAIEEKRMFDALLEARDMGLIRAITDCGAAGFSSAVGEMGEETGVTVDISKAPVKYPGLAPWEIWLSESQERMVAAVSDEDLEQFLAVCEKYNVEATSIGLFDGSNRLTVNYGGTNVASLDYGFLKSGLPQRVMEAHYERETIREIKPETPGTPEEWVERIKAVLSHGNVCSKEPVVRQYDHGVQGGNIVAPFGGIAQDGPNDALVVRPMLDKEWGMVVSHGMNPVLNKIDPYEGTKWAIAEAAANYVSAGGRLNDAGAIGNYIWPFPDKEAMGSLDRAVDAAVDMMDVLGVPVVSGKDSLSSTYKGADGTVIKIPPVYTASLFGRIPDVEKTMTTDLKKPTSTLVLVGSQNKNLGGSSYYDVAGGESGELPEISGETLPEVLKGVEESIASGKVLSCHDVSEGGIISAVSEMCIGGNIGADLWAWDDLNDIEGMLFSETAGTFVVEVEDIKTAHELFGSVQYKVIGWTREEKKVQLKFDKSGETHTLFSAEVNELKEAWQGTMKEVYPS